MSDLPEDLVVSHERGEPAAVFRALADLVGGGDDFSDLYDAVCRAATLLVTGCHHASLMLRGHDEPYTAAASDDVARVVDRIERELGEGPCIDAIEEESGYVDSDIRESTPWPRLAARVLEETPVRGMAGFRLVVASKKKGALNLFSDDPGGLTEASISEAAMLTAFVSVALVAAHESRSARTLREGLESNREIGKAVGLLMAFHQIRDDEAFELLRKASQDMNLKLAEVSREVVAHHNSRE